MGDRISVSFKADQEESVVIFSHWGGMEFYQNAKNYVQSLKRHLKLTEGPCSDPLGRLEPNTVMVDFIRHITKPLERVNGDLYLGKTANDGDNSDNGHFTIDLNPKT